MYPAQMISFTYFATGSNAEALNHLHIAMQHKASIQEWAILQQGTVQLVSTALHERKPEVTTDAAE